MDSPKTQCGLSLPSESPKLSFQPQLKTEGDPREKQRQKLFSFSQQLFVQSIFLPLPYFISYYSCEQVCLPRSSDEEREVPSVKADMLTGSAKSQS